MMQVTDDTPIAMLTVGQLRDFILQSISATESKKSDAEDKPEFVHGIKGIMELFSVSHVTAQRYKNTFLKPAIRQRGKKIIVDVKKAYELFTENNKSCKILSHFL